MGYELGVQRTQASPSNKKWRRGDETEVRRNDIDELGERVRISIFI